MISSSQVRGWSTLRAEEREHLERPAQGRLAGQPQPVFEHAGVDAPEINRHPEAV